MSPFAGLRAVLLILCMALAARAQGAPKPYRCPPCNAGCDSATYDKAGACPTCGMPLQQQPARVAILLFEGVQIIDFTGPHEMFGAAGFEVVTVAATRKAIHTSMGLEVVPAFTFQDAPAAEVLVIPGGAVSQAEQDVATLAFVRKASAASTLTLSVCNGAFILAKTGLLDGLSATTTRGNVAPMARKYPKVKVVGDRRYVDNGKLITAAGLSAGIDGALHVIERLRGREVALGVAKAEEYAWGEGK